MAIGSVDSRMSSVLVCGVAAPRNPRGSTVTPHRFEIGPPLHLAAQPPDLGLFAESQQRLQAQEGCPA